MVFGFAALWVAMSLAVGPRCPHCGAPGKPRPVVGSGAHCPSCWRYVP